MTEWYEGLTFEKDTLDELVYEVDFGGEFGLHNIASANVSGDGVDIASYSFDGQVLVFKVTGGVVDTTGSVSITVDSDAETTEKLNRKIYFKVLDL